jgi:hypothetical protein
VPVKKKYLYIVSVVLHSLPVGFPLKTRELRVGARLHGWFCSKHWLKKGVQKDPSLVVGRRLKPKAAVGCQFSAVGSHPKQIKTSDKRISVSGRDRATPHFGASVWESR